VPLPHTRQCDRAAPRCANSWRSADLHAVLEFGVTPLQVAAESGHESVLQLLLTEIAAGRCSVASAEGAVAARRGSDGRSAWLVAAAEGHLGCCKQLWTAAGSTDAAMASQVDRDKRGALILAARGGHVLVCDWLLEVGSGAGLADVDACGWTPLIAAAAEGQQQVVRCLLESRADIAAADDEGRTAFTWASLRRHGLVEALLRDAEKAVAAS